MLATLAIRLGMFMLTMGVVLWIGRTVPQPQESAAVPFVSTDSRAQVSVPAPAVTQVPATTSAPPPPHAATPKRIPGEKTIDLNRASAQDLEALPGIGPVLAERIVAYRQTSGSFSTVDDLRGVKGIGKKTLEKIRTLVSVVPQTKLSREGKKTL